MNGWRFHLWLKRQFQGLWNKESGKWEAAEVLDDDGRGLLGRFPLQRGGRLEKVWKFEVVETAKAELLLNVHGGDGGRQ